MHKVHILQHFVCHPFKAFAMAEPPTLTVISTSPSFLSLSVFKTPSFRTENLRTFLKEDEDEDPFISGCVLRLSSVVDSALLLLCYHCC